MGGGHAEVGRLLWRSRCLGASASVFRSPPHANGDATELLMAAPALVIVMVVALVVIGPTQGPRQVGYGRWGAADGGPVFCARTLPSPSLSLRGSAPLMSLDTDRAAPSLLVTKSTHCPTFDSVPLPFSLLSFFQVPLCPKFFSSIVITITHH